MDSVWLIQQKIKENRQLSSLSSSEVTLLAACKSQTAEAIEQAIAANITDFGENRVQEALAKWPPLKKKYPHVRLHLIGPLQTNKVAEALALFDVIQTLDRPKLALAVSSHNDSRLVTRDYYIQVNTGDEPQKSGVSPNEANDFIAYCRALKLNVVGLMCVPPASDMPAPHFALLKKIADKNNLEKLSMGMSGDYETAVRMGSTCVRIGTALFGKRN